MTELRALPDDARILIPLRDVVLFPGVLTPVTVRRQISVAAAQQAVKTEQPVGFLLQRDPQQDVVAAADLHQIGTLGPIARYMTGQDGAHHLLVQGQSRFRVLEFLDGWPFLVARVELLEASDSGDSEIEARLLQLKQQALSAIELLPNVPTELGPVIQSIDSAGLLADMVTNLVDIKPEAKQAILETIDLVPRLDKVIALLGERLEVLRLSKEIGERTRAQFDEKQRETVLREQLRQIQRELGDSEDTAAELEQLKSAIDAAGMPDDAARHARKEFSRLQRMGENSSESAMLRTYLEWLTELPWRVQTPSPIDLAQARAILDEDHYGLEKIKRRILEYLAVRKLNPQGRSPILCFVGPPGVGKTSLGQSIARATDRAFQRVALGGVHDEAEIRGHRRTYLGALPGNIIQAIKRAGTNNLVLMLDEIDKLGAGGFHGDPGSALLEVLDPEQNQKFRDNYLALDFDLSNIMFICTANALDTIPGPLRDRMEVIALPGYTEEEKIQIARRYLVQRQREANGLREAQADITDAALATIVADYTREAGVRNLEREIGAVFRHAAMQIAEGRTGQVHIDSADLAAILGPQRFENEVAQRTSVPGVATGLAWTPVGGDILFIEASKTPGSGRLILTGQLGDVMKESGQTALTLAKTWLGDALDKQDIHIHVPAGATPKDGPSAGVAMFVALVSLLSDKAVSPAVAMTGEISLRGMVLPIGGVKEKTLAALRAGIRIVMLPRRNARDLEDVPAHAREKLEFVLLDTVEDALKCAIEGVCPTGSDKPAQG
ncbi:endopeptidase La [Bordetella trematum]|uniref:Lon protease n=1 Tax=Bordetella trematum TaxID=123899 RepID=A0A157LSH5_9BORD|nr:endopeptidase La [Bordetella trematum]AZR94675.1 endopeptidase La [Bordetella trematum]NNH19430.1 endopeptidase La [Bordetella trematum]SAH99638.1 ATP-dependent protease La [Bordetella trematum]SAI74045.1 ATP-dependent protease La [Bordetella trematum]SUV97072.1 ATP-dependent protease La [Bordetella trematum]